MQKFNYDYIFTLNRNSNTFIGINNAKKLNTALKRQHN